MNDPIAHQVAVGFRDHVAEVDADTTARQPRCLVPAIAGAG
jgi:hypothetical protein